MFDLFGFWSAVSVMTVAPLLLCYYLLVQFVRLECILITKGERDDWHRKMWMGKQVDRGIDEFLFGLPYASYILVVPSVMLNFFLLCMYCWGESDWTWVQGVAKLSEYLAPLFGWVFAVAGPVILLHVVAQKMYALSKKVDKALESKN